MCGRSEHAYGEAKPDENRSLAEALPQQGRHTKPATLQLRERNREPFDTASLTPKLSGCAGRSV